MFTREYVQRVLVELAPFLKEDQEVKFHIETLINIFKGDLNFLPCYNSLESGNSIEFSVKITPDIMQKITRRED